MTPSLTDSAPREGKPHQTRNTTPKTGPNTLVRNVPKLKYELIRHGDDSKPETRM